MAFLEFLKLAFFAITRNNGAPSAIPALQAPGSGSTAQCAVRSGGSPGPRS
jgi:hypothetical protein